MDRDAHLGPFPYRSPPSFPSSLFSPSPSIVVVVVAAILHAAHDGHHRTNTSISAVVKTPLFFCLLITILNSSRAPSYLTSFNHLPYRHIQSSYNLAIVRNPSRHHLINRMHCASSLVSLLIPLSPYFGALSCMDISIATRPRTRPCRRACL